VEEPNNSDIFCRVTSDFLSFIVVELIQFFHRTLQFIIIINCWLGDRKGIRPVKMFAAGLLVVTIWYRLTQVVLENGC